MPLFHHFIIGEISRAGIHFPSSKEKGCPAIDRGASFGFEASPIRGQQ